jgi:hypothetical protein
MNRMIAWLLVGVLAMLLAALALAQQHIPYDEFNVNDNPPMQRQPRGPHGNPGPSQTITGETMCKQGCPTGTQGFGRAPKEPVIAEHRALQECHWMIRNSTQAQDPIVMENIKPCRDREMAPGVPAVLRDGLLECWGLIHRAYDKSFEAWEGFRRGGTGLRGNEITALRKEAARILSAVPGCLDVAIRQLDGYMMQTTEEGGPIIAQKPKPPEPSPSGNHLCPDSLTMLAEIPIMLKSSAVPVGKVNAVLRTGVGAAYRMTVAPSKGKESPSNWDGTQIAESLATISNTCPAQAFPPGRDPCAAAGFGDATFTVGDGGTAFGETFPAEQNTFIDLHTLFAGESILHRKGEKTAANCQVKCDQTYSCGGKPIGHFKVEYTLRRKVLGGKPVTTVDVKKTIQPLKIGK